MSQALHTASTGINAGQSQINVIANNVANINTTAFKSANVTFETLYSNNLSHGSAATKDGGGTNPKQIGLGTKIGGITRNFTSGQFVQTGRSSDVMISGSGFFVVQDADGKQYFTRDGIFSTDSAGNLVTNAGMKVVGAEALYSTSSSSTTVNIPTNLKIHTGGSDITNKKISELNDAMIKSGDIGLEIYDSNNTLVKKVSLTIPTTNMTISQMIANFTKPIEYDTTGNPTNANETLAGTDISIIANNDGTLEFTTGTNGQTIKFDPSTTSSNFLAQTGINDNNLQSRILNQSADLQDIVYYNDADAVALRNITIDENGIIAASYSDGSILTKYVDSFGSLEWKYTTKDAVDITGSDVKPSDSLMANSNFVIELATMVNQEGLVSINHNLWEWGPGVGEIYYGVAGEMAFGALEAGGYEGSNVDIAAELTNMISAQRMIQMNSRVFSTASSVMETLAYLGQ